MRLSKTAPSPSWSVSAGWSSDRCRRGGQSLGSAEGLLLRPPQL
ncbi:MAG: hypothetical protein OXG81_13930 [Acidobacteria bacterium]|nr:hypothetical protein [Acidobacteriota bacterium]